MHKIGVSEIYANFSFYDVLIYVIYTNTYVILYVLFFPE